MANATSAVTFLGVRIIGNSFISQGIRIVGAMFQTGAGQIVTSDVAMKIQKGGMPKSRVISAFRLNNFESRWDLVSFSLKTTFLPCDTILNFHFDI
jgi:hypothetical protein